MNLQLFNFLYGFAHQSAALDSLIVFFATDFALIVIVAIFFYLYRHHDKKRGTKEVLAVTLAAVLAWFVSKLIKYGYPVDRPGTALEGVTPLFEHGGGTDSFPSGHATLLAGFAGAFFRYHRRLAYFLLGVAALVGLARIAAGVHFPVDVGAGLVIGWVIGYALSSYFARHTHRLPF